jgi:hypothetical protein
MLKSLIAFRQFVILAFRVCLIEEQKLGVAVHIQKLNNISPVCNTRISQLFNQRTKVGRGCAYSKAK